MGQGSPPLILETPPTPKRPLRSRWAGRVGFLPFLSLLWLPGLLPEELAAQVPPDSVPPDSAEAVPMDTIPGQQEPADTVQAPDTLPAVRMPALPRPVPAGWHTGVWEWDRDAILGSRALTLAELVSGVPGVVSIRGGDFGAPRSVSAFGAGGGRIRVFRDGVEILPLEGSVTDLSRVGLAGLQTVRVVRATGEIRIELESMLTAGGRPYSLVEAGTGDLNTNLFRGTFAHPRALGGAVALGIDRVDTQGLRGQEPGASTGGWIRYARTLTERGVIALDYARSSSNRGEVFSPSEASRSDWSVRTRWRILPGLDADVYYASSSLKTEEPDTFDFGLEGRSRLGGLLSYRSSRLRGRVRGRLLSGEGLPSYSASLALEGDLSPVGGVSGELQWESWGGESATRNRVRLWSAPFFGFSVFAERGGGRYGLPYLPARPPPDPDGEEDQGGETQEPEENPPLVPGPRFSETTGVRFGFQYRRRGLFLGVARVTVESDSLFLLGLPLDRQGETFPGGKREGLELSARVPLYPAGLALRGSYQWWDQPEDVRGPVDGNPGGTALLSQDEMPWRYLPRHNYQAELSFHDTFFPTENLEVWFDIGVRGREPMASPFPEDAGGQDLLVPTMVPFYQSWFTRLQIRVVTVRAFIVWENFTLRQSNQDLPGRILPATRSLYGVRWTMWN